MTTFSIYGIVDPDTKQIRYVGYTRKSPTERLIHHLSGSLSSSSVKGMWLSEIVQSGRLPDFVVLQTADNERSAQIAERWWIAHGQAIGWELVNDAQMVKLRLNKTVEKELVDILDSSNTPKITESQRRIDADTICDAWQSGKSHAEMIRVLTGDPAANTGGHNRRRLMAALSVLEGEPTEVSFPLLIKRPLTQDEAKMVRKIAPQMSKNQLCIYVYGSKSSRYMEWIDEALTDTD